MARQKRTDIRRLPPIDLNGDNPDELRLWEHYQALTRRGKAAEWIRSALIAALPSSAGNHPAPRQLSRPAFRAATPDQDDGLQYEDVQE